MWKKKVRVKEKETKGRKLPYRKIRGSIYGSKYKIRKKVILMFYLFI